MRLIHLPGPAHTKAATKLPCSSHGATSELPATRGEVGPWTPWRGCHLGLISGTDKVRVGKKALRDGPWNLKSSELTIWSKI